jgi:hypothetical protein
MNCGPVAPAYLTGSSHCALLDPISLISSDRQANKKNSEEFLENILEKGSGLRLSRIHGKISANAINRNRNERRADE